MPNSLARVEEDATCAGYCGTDRSEHRWRRVEPGEEAADLEAITTNRSAVTGGEPRTPVERLVREHFGGDYTQVLLALARRGRIAVNYLDKDWVVAHGRGSHGLVLTDEQFEELSPWLEGYDEHVCLGFGEAQSSFVDQLLRDEGLLE